MASSFDEYKSETDKYDSLFTIVVYNTSATVVHENVIHQLTKINTIKNSVKRKYLNDRMYGFSTYITEQPYYSSNDIINKVFLIGAKINEINMDKKWIQLLNHYSVSKYIFRNGETFDIDYLVDLLTNDKYKNVLSVKNNIVTHIHFTHTKKREDLKFDLKNKKIEDYLKEIIKQQDCVIHGVSSCFKTLSIDGQLNNKTIVVPNVHLKDEDLRDEFKKLEMVELHDRLQIVMDYIGNPKMMDRVLIGNPILTNLKNQMVKTIFCTPPRHKKLLELFSEDEISNCEIIVVVPLLQDDPVMTLRKNYNGIIGLTYY